MTESGKYHLRTYTRSSRYSPSNKDQRVDKNYKCCNFFNIRQTIPIIADILMKPNEFRIYFSYLINIQEQRAFQELPLHRLQDEPRFLPDTGFLPEFCTMTIH
ncbi:hypothetical protein BpHYR1_003192 [Brachionus plicatilis]|uniref:Uncharacterized protein n=1 Tax=Brachionus plicatilis TaxID=10195 RepID=A0A3M7R0I3_BRAPC|nr:hypothetical protein BpHYR1_003192 [Brachionus plicatilis]